MRVRRSGTRPNRHGTSLTHITGQSPDIGRNAAGLGQLHGGQRGGPSPHSLREQMYAGSRHSSSIRSLQRVPPECAHRQSHPKNNRGQRVRSGRGTARRPAEGAVRCDMIQDSNSRVTTISGRQLPVAHSPGGIVAPHRLTYPALDPDAMPDHGAPRPVARPCRSRPSAPPRRWRTLTDSRLLPSPSTTTIQWRALPMSKPAHALSNAA